MSLERFASGSPPKKAPIVAEADIEQLNTQGNYDAGVSPSKRRGWVWLAVIGAGAGAGIAVGLAKRGGGSNGSQRCLETWLSDSGSAVTNLFARVS